MKKQNDILYKLNNKNFIQIVKIQKCIWAFQVVLEIIVCYISYYIDLYKLPTIVSKNEKEKEISKTYLCNEATPSQRRVAIAASTALPFFFNTPIPMLAHSCPFVDTAAYLYDHRLSRIVVRSILFLLILPVTLHFLSSIHLLSFIRYRLKSVMDNYLSVLPEFRKTIEFNVASSSLNNKHYNDG